MAARCKTTENDGRVRTFHRRGPMGRLWQWDTNFLVSVISGRGGYLLQEASVCPVISCIFLSALMADQSGIVFFQMSQCLKMKSESWSKWDGRENGSSHQAGNTVKLKRFLSLLRVGCVSSQTKRVFLSRQSALFALVLRLNEGCEFSSRLCLFSCLPMSFSPCLCGFFPR